MTILKKIVQIFLKIFKSLRRVEKSLLLLFLIILVLSSATLSRRQYLRNTKIVAAAGGILKEGLVVTKSELDQVLDQLSKSSLLYLDSNNELKGQLVSNFKISDDAKNFSLELKEGILADDILARIQERKDLFANIEVNKSGERTIEFKLRQAYGLFLLTLTAPIFENGPYILEKQTKEEIILKSNEQFVPGRPLISKIELNIYADQKNAEIALKKREVDSLVNTNLSVNGFSKYTITLPQYLILFFNHNNPKLSLENRRKMANFEKLDSDLSLTLATTKSELNLNWASNLKKRWEEKGAKIEIKLYDTEILEKDIIPPRSFDLLLLGINLGRENDPYPFWHSKEVSSEGRNFANFKNAKMDQALEGLRKKTTLKAQDEARGEVTKIIEEERPALFLDQQIVTYMVSDKIKGLSNQSGGNLASRFNEVWNWYIETKRVKI